MEDWQRVIYRSPPSSQVVAAQQSHVTKNCVPQQRSRSRTSRTGTCVSPCADSIGPRFVPPPQFNVSCRDPQRMVQRQSARHECLPLGHTCSFGTTRNPKNQNCCAQCCARNASGLPSRIQSNSCLQQANSFVWSTHIYIHKNDRLYFRGPQTVEASTMETKLQHARLSNIYRCIPLPPFNCQNRHIQSMKETESRAQMQIPQTLLNCNPV